MENVTLTEDGQLVHGDDSKSWVQFRMHPVRQGFLSEKEGRDIYQDVPYIKIMTPGNKSSVVDRPVQDSDKQRWPRQYAAFEAKKPQDVVGTPLSEWTLMTPARVAEMSYLNVHTVEQLAGMPDGSIDRMGMGSRDLVNKAKTWLANAKDGAHAVHLAGELKHRDDEIAELKRQVAELAAKFPKGKAA